MLEIAERNGVTDKLPFKDVDQARTAFQFNNLQDFLDIYYCGCAVLIQEQVPATAACLEHRKWCG